ncbi:hypothetical protein Tco_1009301 [Tanacetum coccineum]
MDRILVWRYKFLLPFVDSMVVLSWEVHDYALSSVQHNSLFDLCPDYTRREYCSPYDLHVEDNEEIMLYKVLYLLYEMMAVMSILDEIPSNRVVQCRNFHISGASVETSWDVQSLSSTYPALRYVEEDAFNV